MAKRGRKRKSNVLTASPSRVTGAEVIHFIESYCHIVIGNVAQPMILPPWLREEISTIYDNTAGTRRHVLSVGRKNSKTTTCAALMLNHLCGPSANIRRNSDLYSTALSRDQASLLYAAAAKMVRLSPTLSRIVRIRETAKELVCDELGTKYRALSADASRNLGLNPAFAVHDELGSVIGPHSDLFEAIETAGSAQRDPLSIVISTQAASDADLLSVLIDDAMAGHDPRMTASLYCAPADIDPFSEQAIRCANPNFDLMNASELLSQAAAARRMPSRESDYRRFVLNQRIQVATPLVSPALWSSCSGAVAPLNELPVIYAGLDLSAVSDLSALVLVGLKAGKWHVHCRFWLPREGLSEKAASDHAPYVMWQQQGHLEVTPGKIVDYEYLAMQLRDLLRKHNIQKVAFDPWGWTYFRPALLRAEFTESMISDHFQEHPQSTKVMSPALANFERLLLDGKLVHDNPILSMCVANTVTRTDSAGNRAPDKKKSTRRIDGLVAMVMALAMAPQGAKEIDISTLIA